MGSLAGIYQIPEENWLSIFLPPLMANSCSDVSRISQPSSHLMLGFMSGLMSGMICACSHSECQVIYATIWLWLDNTVGLCHPPLQAFTIFLTPVWQWFLSLGKMRYDMDIPLRDEHSTTFYFLRAGQLRIFVCVFFYWQTSRQVSFIFYCDNEAISMNVHISVYCTYLWVL